MSKNIIFCADGTWNSPDQDENGDDVPDTTNVYKLFSFLKGEDDPASLALQDEQERMSYNNGELKQIAKYLHGVGDSSNPITKILGGAFGAGIIERIVRGYTFISRNYQEGDKITLIGFSRGAYTARALAGCIASMGLLDAEKIDLTDKMTGYRYGISAWFEYRKKVLVTRSLLDKFKRTFDGIMHKISCGMTTIPYRDAAIQSVGVWDTVGALGIPVSFAGAHVDVFKFVDTKLHPKVAFGFHAVSLDEQRTDFTPTLWDLRSDGSIQQTCFCGAHADVGGGYPTVNDESALSNIALKWMIEQLQPLNILFRDNILEQLGPDNSRGIAHMPWIKMEWSLREKKSRAIPQRSVTGLHPSVMQREGQSVKPDPSSPETIYRHTPLS